jgi:hypothetical protein
MFNDISNGVIMIAAPAVRELFIVNMLYNKCVNKIL